MKVRIAVTIEVDPAAWAREYSVATSEVREDVKVWAENLMNTQLEVMGVLPESV